MIESFPPMVQTVFNKMDEDQRLAFQQEYENKKMNKATIYVATIFGIHFFFYDRIGLGIVYILLMLAGPGFIWWIVEICLAEKRLREYNDRIALNIAHNLKIMDGVNVPPNNKVVINNVNGEQSKDDSIKEENSGRGKEIEELQDEIKKLKEDKAKLKKEELKNEIKKLQEEKKEL